MKASVPPPVHASERSRKSLDAGGRRRRGLALAAVAAAASLALLTFVALAPRHHLEGLLGSHVAVARDLVMEVGRYRGEAVACVVIGDSRAAAFERWPSDCQVINVALYGSTTHLWRNLLGLLEATVPRNARVAVWLGVNDLRYDPDADRDTTADNLVAIVRRLATHDRRVWVLPQIPVHFPDAGRNERFRARNAYVHTALRRAFDDDDRVTLLDASPIVGTPAQPRPEAYFDSVHLTEGASEAVRRLLERAWRP